MLGLRAPHSAALTTVGFLEKRFQRWLGSSIHNDDLRSAVPVEQQWTALH